MLEYIKGFKTEFDDRLNRGIMNHEFDRPLVEHILDAWKSLEIVDSIKIIDQSYSEEEHELDVDKYQRKKQSVYILQVYLYIQFFSYITYKIFLPLIKLVINAKKVNYMKKMQYYLYTQY